MRVTIRKQVARGGKAAKAYQNSRNRARTQTLKKTTRRGAYRPQQKRNFAIRRAPFVETKSKTSEDLLAMYPHLPDHIAFTERTTAHRHMNPDVFTVHQQGLDEHQVVARQIFAKYLNMKLTVRFPQSAFSVNGVSQIVPLVPQNYELIWGWVPNPLQATGSTTPSAPNMTLSDINTHINLRVVDYFNQQKDNLRFIPKKASTIRITGRRKIRPNLNRSSTAPAQTIDSITGADYVVGSIPDVNMNIQWKIGQAGRKLHLEHAANLVPNSLKPLETHPGLFPNYSWLPFCVLVNWDYEDLPSPKTPYMPSVAYNQILYYTDS